MKLRIALISDIHHNKATIEYRPGNEAMKLIPAFIGEAEEENADIIIELGDRIGNASHDEDLMHLKEVAGAFSKSRIPVLHALGNHDLHFLSEAENLDILGMESPYYAISICGYRLIVLNTAEPTGNSSIMPGDAQIEWLADEIEKATEKVIVFSHHPLIQQDQKGNPFFVDNPNGYKITDEARLQAILLANPKVIASINGHVHWNYCTEKDGIPFISVPSLIESYPETTNAPGQYIIAEINDDDLDISLNTLVPKRTSGRILLPIS